MNSNNVNSNIVNSESPKTNLLKTSLSNLASTFKEKTKNFNNEYNNEFDEFEKSLKKSHNQLRTSKTFKDKMNISNVNSPLIASNFF